MSKWRPIVSAPDHGIMIVLVWGEYVGAAYKEYWAGGGWRAFTGHRIKEPTHWMHLPKPPKVTNSSGPSAAAPTSTPQP